MIGTLHLGCREKLGLLSLLGCPGTAQLPAQEAGEALAVPESGRGVFKGLLVPALPLSPLIPVSLGKDTQASLVHGAPEVPFQIPFLPKLIEERG